MKLVKIMLLVLSAVTVSATPESADAQGGKGPCSEDIQKLCAGVQAGGGRYRACLQQHEAELSAPCLEHLKTAQARAGAGRQACEGDVEKLCSGREAGGGKILQCLREHQAELSVACQDQLSKAQHRHRGGIFAPGQ
ncbi:MAG: hypothetical protein H6Q33_1517 [Deltaproteobacteria bacterium]|nr:hypothetical protein [Deltaproteobacteria bacterium]